MNKQLLCQRANALSVLVFVALASAGNSACATDGDVITFGAAQSLQYDSNLFRLPDGVPSSMGDQRHDTVSTTTLLIKANKEIGRHALTADLSHSLVRFFEYGKLDHQAADYRLGWHGGFGSDSSYGVDYRRQKAQSNFADTSSRDRNVVTSDTLGAGVFLRLLGVWYAVGGGGVAKVGNSAASEASGDNESVFIEYGARFDPRSGNWIDLRSRNSHSRYTSVVAAGIRDNTHDQDELRLTWRWQPSGASDLDGGISWLRRKHAHLSERDFADWVGNLNYTWRPDDFVSLKLTAYRSVGAITDYSATYAKTDGVSVSPAWMPTAKVRAEGFWDWHRRRYQGDSLLSPAFERRRENVRALGLSLTYMPTRTLQLRAAFRKEGRQGNSASLQYADDSAYLSAQVMF